MIKHFKRFFPIIFSLYLLAIGFFSTACSSGEELQKRGITLKSNQTVRIFADRPPSPDREILQAYKDCGFTHFVLGEDDVEFTDDEGNLTKEYVNALKLCEELGLKVIIRNYRDDADYFVNEVAGEKSRMDYLGNIISYYMPKRNITTQFKEFSVIDGYYMCDEPTYGDMQSLTKLVDWFNSYGNDTLFHVNLTGSVLGTSLMQNHSYSEYVENYVNTIAKNVKGHKTLSVDFYPLMEKSFGVNYLQPEILNDYGIIAGNVKTLNATLDENNKVYTNFCVQTFKENSGWKWRDLVCEEDVSFQTNLAFAFGGKSFEYYLYRGMPDSTGIVEYGNQQPEKMYPWVQKVNGDMQKMANLVFAIEWNGFKTFQGTQIQDKYNKQAFDLVKSKELESFRFLKDATCRLDTLVSEFIDENGSYAYMVLNYSEPSLKQVDSVKLDFGNHTKAKTYINGEEKEIELVNGKANLSIPSGGAVVICPIA